MNIKSVICIFAVIIISSCAKNQAVTRGGADPCPTEEQLRQFFSSSYEFEISAQKNILSFQERGYRDVAGGVSVSGFMEIKGEDKLEYDHLFFDGTWYKRKDLKRETYNQPVDPTGIIENSIIGGLKHLSHEKGIHRYEIEMNVAVVDPLNYSAKGILTVDDKMSRMTLEADKSQVDYRITLKKKNFKPVKVPKEAMLSCGFSGSKKDVEILGMRLEEANVGSVKNKTIELYMSDFSIAEAFLEEDSLSFYSYEYVDPSYEGGGIAFVQGDVRNTLVKTEKLFTVKSSDYEVFPKGREYEVVFKNVNAERNERMVMAAGNFAFPAEYEPNTKNLRIGGLNEEEMLLLLSLAEYPYLNGKTELIKEE